MRLKRALMCSILYLDTVFVNDHFFSRLKTVVIIMYNNQGRERERINFMLIPWRTIFRAPKFYFILISFIIHSNKYR